jgi:ABC-2 type transport system ATP-binding protein
VDGLTFRYGRMTALSKVSLSVEAGEVYALLGRNGSGKSSFVLCLLGQRRADGGRVEMLGLDSWHERRKLMERVAVVPESPDVPPEMTARAVGRFVARLTPRWDADLYRDRLASFRIPDGLRFDRLSKGQQRQLALALALATRPDVLVLDDPTLGLDAVARRELFGELIGDLADHGTTVLMTTHDLEGVEGLADRVGILVEGRLVVDEHLEALKARFWTIQLTDRAVSAGAEQAIARLGEVSRRVVGSLAEVVVAGADEVALARLRQETGAAFEPRPMSLEEIFVAVCGGTGGV